MKLCIAPCHICLIYGIWGSKEVGDPLQSPLGKCKQQGEGGSFYGEGGFSLRNTNLLKFHCKSYWVL